MVALQIRDVPDDVRDALMATAKARGMSLQGLLLDLVTTEARRTRNLAILGRARNRTGKYETRSGDAARELEANRAERIARLDGDA